MSSSSDFLKSYDIAEPTIRKLYDSRLRLAIIDALKDGPMRLADLRRAVDANAPNTSTKAKDLGEIGIVERVGGNYQLTPYGKAVKEQTESSLDFYATYEKFKDLWETHHTEGIPQEFLFRLGELYNSELIRCSKENPIATHEALVRYLQTVKKEMYAISPVIQNEWVHVLAQLMDNGVKMETVLTEAITKQFAGVAKQAGRVDDFDKNIGFYINTEKYSLPGTLSSDSFCCFAIESKAVPGNYFDMKLYSTDSRAIKWAEDLYKYFKERAKPVKLSDYL